MDDGADVGLVDAHAEGHRRHHDAQPPRHEVVLHGPAAVRRESGVVGLGREGHLRLALLAALVRQLTVVLVKWF